MRIPSRPTILNPKDFKYTCGFDDAREQRLGSMLLYADVYKDPKNAS